MNQDTRIRGILEAALYVDDLDAAERFYGGILGLPRIVRQEGRHVFFRCGSGVVLLFDPEATREPTQVAGSTIPPHGAWGPGHLALLVRIDEIDAWVERLRDRGVAIESDVAWPRGGRSIYFRDPAGNSVEIASPELWDPAGPAGEA